MTTFGDMVFEMGGVPVGVGRLASVFEKGNIFFVDGDNGATANYGKRPDDAFLSISEAVSAASKGATIYVRPRTTVASAQTYYLDSIDIPLTKPGISIFGCGNSSPNSYGGVQLKPTTAGAGDHLIDVKGASCLLENMRLTLTGGTADASKCIVHAVNATSVVPSGLTIRNCWFDNDKSHPGISGSDATSSIGIACEEVTVEDCFFIGCLGGIAIQAVSGSPRRIRIRRNFWGENVADRDCDLIISINSGTAAGIIVHDNVFADGLPAHSGGGTLRFIKFPYLTAGTGILSHNFFAAADTEGQYGETGTDAIIADNFFTVGNWVEGSGTTAPYGIITT